MSAENNEGESNTGAEQITIVIRDQHGEEIQFKIKKSMKLSKVCKVYADRKGLDVKALRFLYDGERLDLEHGDHTAKMLEMEDMDRIDCVLAQEGGTHFCANDF